MRTFREFNGKICSECISYNLEFQNFRGSTRTPRLPERRKISLSGSPTLAPATLGSCLWHSTLPLLYKLRLLLQFFLRTLHFRQPKIQTFQTKRDLFSYYNMASFFRFVDKRAIYRWYNLIRTCAGVSECDWLFHWQHKLCATFSASVNINYRLPIKVYTTVFVLLDIWESK